MWDGKYKKDDGKYKKDCCDSDVILFISLTITSYTCVGHFFLREAAYQKTNILASLCTGRVT